MGLSTSARTDRVATGVSLQITAQPGNGTRYCLVVACHPDGGEVVTWLDGHWFGWFDRNRGQLTSKAGRLGMADRLAIEEILAKWLKPDNGIDVAVGVQAVAGEQ